MVVQHYKMGDIAPMFVMSRVCDSSKGFHYHNSIFLLSEHFLARRFVENPSTVLDAERAVVENG